MLFRRTFKKWPARWPALALTVAVLLAVPLAAVFASRPAVTTAQVAGGVALQPVVSGLSAPVLVTQAPDSAQRLYIVERGGTIRVAVNGALQSTPFVDLTSVVNDSGFEMGLLGLAFHPQYASNGYFWVYYTASNGDNTLARLRRSGSDPLRADPASLQVLLALDDPYANHNGGMVAFGPDGYLYVGTGDGGSAGDPENRAQDLGSLFGKLLRLNVSTATTGPLYSAPPSNPFVNRGGAMDEIWALGLRNPWRFSFDRQTNDLWIGDVGQGAWEEINRLGAGSAGGANFQWRCREGFEPYNGSPPCDEGSSTPPVHAYDHSGGSCSVTGGYVYRGNLAPSLRGLYVFGDYCSGRIWTLRQTTPGTWLPTQLLDTGYSISSFGEDSAGELYLTDIVGGTVYRFAAATTPTPGPSPTATATLPAGAQTVTFDDRSGEGQPLEGQYPAGVIDWGSGQWYLSPPFGQLSSKSVSVGDGRTSATFTFLTPRTLLQLYAYNGGAGLSTVSASCAGQPTRQVTLNAGQMGTISTGWSGTCNSVTLTSSNGWDTNFDDLVIAGGSPPAPTATATATRTPTPPPGMTPSRTPTQGPRADLQVTDFAVASGAADVPLPVNITVRNGGSQDAGPFDVHIYADAGPGTPAPRLITPHWGLSGLESGQSVTLAGTIEPGTLAAGPHVIFGQADGHDLIQETTKDNNVQSENITVSQPGSTIPTFTPAPTHTQGPTPTATPPAPGGSTTVRFDDRPGQNQPLDGQYPAGLIDWGSGQWFHAGPWGALTSKSASFAEGRSGSTFSFPGTGRLISLRAYNGGEGATTVGLACAGNPTRTQSVAAGQVATISTGWTASCGGPVSVTSSNGWNTNFDDLVVDATEDDTSTPPPGSTAVASPTRTPTLTPTRTPTPQPTATPIPQTLTFDALSGADQLLGGQYPAGVIDWGSGQWYHSGPWEDFSSKSVSFTEGRTSAGITFLTPRRLLSVRAHNGGTGPSTVALACSGQATAQVVVGAGQTATLSTGWKTPCTSVSFSSSNGWETNFDDLVIDGP